MELQEAQKLAIGLMSKHGLIEKGWTFKFDRAVSRNGQCNESKKIISLSGKKVPLNDEPIIKNTILHEIAHALVGCRHHHDEVWRRKAIEIGCTGERCKSGYVKPEPKYIGKCPSGHVFHAHKKRKHEVSCGKCSRKFDKRFIIVFELNENHETFSK